MSKSKFRVSDLVYRDSKVTFILESPHTDEVEQQIPAAGDSGKVMSNELIQSYCSNKAFGKLISIVRKHAEKKDKSPKSTEVEELISEVKKYSVMNASCIPLQHSCYKKHGGIIRNRNMFAIFSACDYKNKYSKQYIQNVFQSNHCGKMIVDDLRQRLEEHINESDCRKFIVCGFNAQAIFELAINKRLNWHTTRKYPKIKLNLNSCKDVIYVFYEYHPSPLSGKWEVARHLDEMKAFIARKLPCK